MKKSKDFEQRAIRRRFESFRHENSRVANSPTTKSNSMPVSSNLDISYSFDSLEPSNSLLWPSTCINIRLNSFWPSNGLFKHLITFSTIFLSSYIFTSSSKRSKIDFFNSFSSRTWNLHFAILIPIIDLLLYLVWFLSNLWCSSLPFVIDLSVIYIVMSPGSYQKLTTQKNPPYLMYVYLKILSFLSPCYIFSIINNHLSHLGIGSAWHIQHFEASGLSRGQRMSYQKSFWKQVLHLIIQ